MKTMVYESVGSYLRIVKIDYASGKSKYVIQMKSKSILDELFRWKFGWYYFDECKDEFGEMKFTSYRTFEDAKKVVDEYIQDCNELESMKKETRRTIL